MSLDLNKLANKLDEALIKETTETLTKFLNYKRMSNNKQSSVEWLIDKIRESEIKCHNYLEILHFMEHERFFEQAKAMHKEEIKEAIMFGDCRGEVSTYKILEQYYNETFGGK